jgi:hypothetical protein
VLFCLICLPCLCAIASALPSTSPITSRLCQEHLGDVDHIHTLLASCFLLSTLTLAQCDQSWVQHTKGMLNMICSADHDLLLALPLGRYLVSMCAFQDISALSVGRAQLSQKAWLSWRLSRPRHRPDDNLTFFETTVGYPETLVDIIARIAELAGDNNQLFLRESMFATAQNDTVAASRGISMFSPGDELEPSISNWSPPDLPSQMSSFQMLALRTAWETLRRTCFLYLWRGCGFNSNLCLPLRQDRERRKLLYLGEIISNIKALVELGRLHGIPIGNSMMWSVAVAACECRSHRPHQQEIVTLLDQICSLYTMDHAQRLKEALTQLWLEQAQPNTEYISLEKVCHRLGIVLPLF